MKQTIERAQWPFKRKRVDKYLQDLVAQKGILVASLEIEHLDQSLNTGHVVSQVFKLQTEDLRREIIKWLSHTDSESNQRAARELHAESTGNWFTHSEKYHDWKTEPNSFLWLYGAAGCGKTILCSEIIEQTSRYCEERPKDRILAYFYFSFRDIKKQKVVNLLRSILSQLLRSTDDVSPTVKTLYEDFHYCEPAPERLLSAIKSLVTYHQEFFVIIDALDECSVDEKAYLCKLLVFMKSWRESRLHVLLTSRKEVDLTDSLYELGTLYPVSIEDYVIKADIEKFVEEQLTLSYELRKWPPDVRAEIKRTLIDRANGMFRWVYCQIDSLKLCITRSDVRKALKSLPKTLDDTYERILMGIPEVHQQRVFVALQWISYAVEPVTTEELEEVVLIDPAVEPTFDPADRPPESGWIVKMLSGLVTSTHATRRWDEMGRYWYESVRTLEIAHFSVKEYLESSRILSQRSRIFYMSDQKALETIVQRSLLYIQCYAHSNKKSSSLRDFEEFPALQYTSFFWAKHLSKTNEDVISPQTKRLILDFWDSDLFLPSWLSIKRPDDNSRGPFAPGLWGNGTPIYYAAFLGISFLVKHLIDRGADVNAKGGRDNTALQAAAKQRDLHNIKLLLEAGADVNINGGLNGSALQAAACHHGSSDVIKCLLDSGADVNIAGGTLRTALHGAASFGDKTTVKLLLEAGADVNIRTRTATVLEAAVNRGDANIVQLIFETGAEAYFQSGEYIAALERAAKCRDSNVVKFLLAAGADVNIQDKEYNAILSTATYYGNLNTVKLLVEAGADVNFREGGEATVLQTATKHTDLDIVKFLLEVGAHVDRYDGEHTALQYAAFHGKANTVKLLLQAGADVNICSGSFGTALHVASYYASWEVIPILITAGANVCVKAGVNLKTSLQAALIGYGEKRDEPERVATMNLLLDAGAEISELNEVQLATLHRLLDKFAYDIRSDPHEKELAILWKLRRSILLQQQSVDQYVSESDLPKRHGEDNKWETESEFSPTKMKVPKRRNGVGLKYTAASDSDEKSDTGRNKAAWKAWRTRIGDIYDNSRQAEDQGNSWRRRRV